MYTYVCSRYCQLTCLTFSDSELRSWGSLACPTGRGRGAVLALRLQRVQLNHFQPNMQTVGHNHSHTQTVNILHNDTMVEMALCAWCCTTFTPCNSTYKMMELWMPSLVTSPLLATISDLAVALFTVISQKSCTTGVLALRPIRLLNSSASYNQHIRTYSNSTVLHLYVAIMNVPRLNMKAVEGTLVNRAIQYVCFTWY